MRSVGRWRGSHGPTRDRDFWSMSAETDQEIARLRVIYPDEVFVGGGCDEALVADAERVLGVRLAPSYGDFLRRYGLLGPSALRGVRPNTSRPRAWRWAERRAEHCAVYAGPSEQGWAPPSFVVVQDHDGVEYACLDTASARSDGECSVVVWSVPTRDVVVRADESFDGYLRTLLSEFEAIAVES